MGARCSLAWPGGRNAPGPVEFEDRDRDVEVLPESIDQSSLLPRVVIRASQRHEDVIGPEGADRVVERRERALIADLGLGVGSGGDGSDVG